MEIFCSVLVSTPCATPASLQAYSAPPMLATILARVVRWTSKGIECEADPKHRLLVMETFGFDEGSRGLVNNCEKNTKEEEDDEEMGKGEGTEFRGVVARMNFLSQDCPDLQFPVKECSKQIAKPTRRAWKSAKKIARY